MLSSIRSYSGARAMAARLSRVSLLEQAIEAHGGRDAWHSREAFELEASVGGIAWALRTRPRPGRFRARLLTAEQRMEILDYGLKGVFEPDLVRIDDGRERRNPRESFGRLSRRLHWDDLDLLYFAGY